MKTLFMSLSLVLVSVISFGQYRNVQLQAAGLTCSMCSNAINKSLKSLPFIDSIKTDLKNNLFILKIKEGTTPDFDLLAQKVVAAGFSVGKLTVEVNFAGLKISNNTHTVVGGKALHFMNVKDQTLNGWKQIQLVDKQYLVASQFKKIQRSASMECYKTGVAGACCQLGDVKAGQRIYHVTI